MVLGVEKADKGMVKIKLQIPKEKFNEGMYKAYLKLRGNYNLPGFRKGKAPKKIIENYYGESIFYEDAVDFVFPEAYKEAIKEKNLEPVERPSVSVEQAGSDKDLIVVAEVTVRPEVKLGKYQGVSVEQEDFPVDPAKVDEEVNRVAEAMARYNDVDRPVKDGDKVFLDYSGSVDGVKFDGGTAENQQLIIGSGQFIPGFEEQIIGMKKDEEKDLNVTFPKEYHAKELAGKDAVFHVVLHDVKEKELPKIDDEFAKDVSEFDTLKEYKASILAKLEKEAATKAKNQLENDVINAAMANMEVELPDVMVELEIGRLIRDLEYKLKYQGIDVNTYLSYIGMTFDQLKEEYRAEAINLVKARLLMEEVQKAEGIEVTDEMLKESMEEEAKKHDKTLEEYKEMLPPGEEDYLRNRLKWQKTIELLVDNAKVKKVAAKKASAAKKTTAKKATAAKSSAAKSTAAKKTTAKKAEETK